MEPLFYPEVWHGPYTANPGERAVRPRRKLISSDQTRAVIHHVGASGIEALNPDLSGLTRDCWS